MLDRACKYTSFLLRKCSRVCVRTHNHRFCLCARTHNPSQSINQPSPSSNLFFFWYLGGLFDFTVLIWRVTQDRKQWMFRRCRFFWPFTQVIKTYYFWSWSNHPGSGSETKSDLFDVEICTIFENFHFKVLKFVLDYIHKVVQFALDYILT